MELQSKPLLNYQNIESEEGDDKYDKLQALDHLQRSIIYPLCRWTYMEGVDGLKVLNPAYTSPIGCLTRSVTFVSNSGSSVVQSELRWDDDHKEYLFWVHASKYDPMEFRSSEYDMDQLIFIYLKILCKWNYGDDNMKLVFQKPTSGCLIKQHLEDFKRRTGVKTLQSERWTYFDALLHHTILCDLDPRKTRYTDILDWRMIWQDGDYLKFWYKYNGKVEWTSPIRSPVSCYLQGKRHSRMCPEQCKKCWTNKLHETFDKVKFNCFNVVQMINKYSGNI